MSENLFNKVYNPDVLSCLANLSNDEVFTPPEVVNKMLDMGVDTFIEIGPGKVLAGLNKKIAPDATVYNVFDLASLEATIEALNAELTNV